MLQAVLLLLSQAPGGAADAAAEQAERALATDPRQALTAGILRAEAGDHAHAWRHFERFLAQQDLGPEDREAGEQRRANLIASTRVISVQLSVPVTATVVARRLGERLPALETPVVAGKAAVRIDLHDWELTVMAPGHAPLQRTVGSQDVVRLLRFTLDPLQQPAAAPVMAPEPTPKRGKPSAELVAGAVLLPLGLVAFGGVMATLPAYSRTGAALDEWKQDLAGRPVTRADVGELRALGSAAQRQEAIMIGLGVAAAALVTIGAILVAHGRHSKKVRRLQLNSGVATFGLAGRF